MKGIYRFADLLVTQCCFSVLFSPVRCLCWTAGKRAVHFDPLLVGHSTDLPQYDAFVAYVIGDLSAKIYLEVRLRHSGRFPCNLLLPVWLGWKPRIHPGLTQVPPPSLCDAQEGDAWHSRQPPADNKEKDKWPGWLGSDSVKNPEYLSLACKHLCAGPTYAIVPSHRPLDAALWRRGTALPFVKRRCQLNSLAFRLRVPTRPHPQPRRPGGGGSAGPVPGRPPALERIQLRHARRVPKDAGEGNGFQPQAHWQRTVKNPATRCGKEKRVAEKRIYACRYQFCTLTRPVCPSASQQDLQGAKWYTFGGRLKPPKIAKRICKGCIDDDDKEAGAGVCIIYGGGVPSPARACCFIPPVELQLWHKFCLHPADLYGFQFARLAGILRYDSVWYEANGACGKRRRCSRRESTPNGAFEEPLEGGERRLVAVYQAV